MTSGDLAEVRDAPLESFSLKGETYVPGGHGKT